MSMEFENSGIYLSFQQDIRDMRAGTLCQACWLAESHEKTQEPEPV